LISNKKEEDIIDIELSELDYIRLMLLVKDNIGSCEVMKRYMPGIYDESQHHYYQGLYNRLDKLMQEYNARRNNKRYA